MARLLVLCYSTYGHIEAMAAAVAEDDGSRRPSAADLAGARFQGGHVAQVAARLFG